MLLSRDVSHDVEHQRAEPNHELRRGGDGLKAEKPTNVRDLVQRELNADLLRQAVKEREPREAANDPGPEKIKDEWQAEKAKQFVLVVNKAHRVHERPADQMERQEGKLTIHDQVRPQEPTGMFASFKKSCSRSGNNAWRVFAVVLKIGSINCEIALV